jgi:hypothetical protein
MCYKINYLNKSVMTNIKLILSILLINIFAISNAQLSTPNFEISWDKDQKPFNEANINSMKILKADSDYIYYYLNTFKLLMIGTKNYHYLVKYDRKTSDYKWLDVTPKDEKNKLSYLTYDTINNAFHFFSYFHNRAQKKLYVFDESFDYEKLSSNNDVKKIAEIDLTDKGSLIDNMFLVSNNGRYLFRYSCESNKGHFYGLEVFNKKLEREWGTFSMALTEKGYNIESKYKIDNEGNVFAIQRNFEKKNDVGSHFDRSRIWAVCYPKDGSEPRSLALILKNDLFITAEQLSLNPKNQIICAGLYARPGTESAIGGFSFVIEPKLAKINAVFTNEFSKELITKGADVKKKNSDVKKIIDQKDFEKNFGYNFNDIHFRNDGGFDLVAEKYYSVLVITRNSSISSSTTYHYFDDLWVLNFNPDGSFKWVQKIPKYEYVLNQYSVIGGYYLYRDKKEELNFIFNIANNKFSFPAYKYFSRTVKIKLDNDGNETFNELINDNEMSNVFVPAYSFTEDNGGIILIRNNNLKAPLPIPGKHNYFNIGEMKFKN